MSTHHVIIGGGPVATNAIETIRQYESEPSQITLICDEPAHSRMALPYWLSGQIPEQHTHTADSEYFQKLNVNARIGQRVRQIKPDQKQLELADGSAVEFDDLLIATGAAPIQLPIPGADLPGVQNLWTIAHTDQLLQATQNLERPRVVMIGAGFIGFIMLNAMHKRGWQLAVVEQADQVLPRMLDSQTAQIVHSWLGRKGVELHCGTTVTAIHDVDGQAKQVELADGSRIDADIVVIAAGIRPNTSFLDGSGIALGDGILVDQRLRTNLPGIYAGGDVVEGPVLGSERREMHPIQPTAVDHGRIAGANMAGHAVDYPGSLLMNILDVCGLQCASFGDWAGQDDTTTIHNADDHIARKLVWNGDQLSGAIFVGQANDMGMLTDVGMVKGFLQTQTALGEWKAFLQQNPFDIRRPYVATQVARKLAQTTLLGKPSAPRGFQFGNPPLDNRPGPHHAVLMDTKTS